VTTTVTTEASVAPYPHEHVRCAVPAGETSPWQYTSFDAIVVCSPGAGGTMKAQATWSLPSVVAADNLNGSSNAVAFDWDSGTVSAKAVETLRRATAVRFVATTQAGVGEVAR
jgi:hypothetical protein